MPAVSKLPSSSCRRRILTWWGIDGPDAAVVRAWCWLGAWAVAAFAGMAWLLGSVVGGMK